MFIEPIVFKPSLKENYLEVDKIDDQDKDNCVVKIIDASII